MVRDVGRGSSVSPRTGRSFSKRVLMLLHESGILKIRAGVRPHRFLGIWVVVVNQRVFVRPWNDKPSGWYRVFLQEPRGAIQIGNREIPIRTRKARGERLHDSVDLAYGEKYITPASKQYVRGFATRSRRTTTIELMPR